MIADLCLWAPTLGPQQPLEHSFNRYGQANISLHFRSSQMRLAQLSENPGERYSNTGLKFHLSANKVIARASRPPAPAAELSSQAVAEDITSITKCWFCFG